MSILEKHLEDLVHLEALWILFIRHYCLSDLSAVSEDFKALVLFQM